MSMTYPALAQPAAWPVRAAAWLAARRERRARRLTERELADLPPHLLRDVGLVDLANSREATGGRTLDHSRPGCTTLSGWSW